MADAMVSVVLEQLSSFVQQEVCLVLCVRKDVQTLTSTLQMVQAVLGDAETKQVKNNAVKLWLENLKYIVYDAEDVLDKWNYTQLKNQVRIQGVQHDGVRIDKKVLSYLLFPCFSVRSVATRYDIGSRIREIRERLDVVSRDKEQLGLNVSPSDEAFRGRLTSSKIDVENTYGREQVKNDLVNWLMGEASAKVRNFKIISIVGTGGFGKTTLANLVVKEEQVEKNFEKKIFVCVSEPFELLKIAKSIIEQVTGNAPSVKEAEPLLQCLCENLNGKRFLIVLDDVWTEDANDWTQLKLAFDGGAQGSRVIVTTRSEKVAQVAGSNHTHNLAKLSEFDSWLFFKHLAFEGKHEELVKFEEIGKEIVAKCKGVPLAIKTVGKLMQSLKTKKEWNDVLTSEIWEIKEIENEIFRSLFLSYNPLPSNLKQCFMYCAIFPKDTQLYKDELVKLWMAQGFLGSGGNRNLEKIGCDYFDDLAMHSFFQDFRKGPEGNITSCKMHDLVHDFALFLTKEECTILEDDKNMLSKKVRHLVTERLESNSSIYTVENLRTLLITRYVDPEQLIKVFNQLKYIRILDLEESWIDVLPRQVKKLLHLRYLNLSSTRLKELPETICYLYNLQTLKLNWCSKLIKLPDGIGNLLNLRHLELEGTQNLCCTPQGIGRLRYLRTLSKFIVGDASNGCNIRELKDLCYLQGSLEIIGLKHVADASEAVEAKLKNKSVVSLSLRFENTEEDDSEKMALILENLEPHENVEELKISSFAGSRLPSWIPNRSMSANLLRLALNCYCITELPVLASLTPLEELELRGMKSVKLIGREFYGLGEPFPKLKKLKIDDMKELAELELPVLKSLQELALSNCPMLRALPPSLGKLESLESLELSKLPQVNYLGQEFYGFDDNDTGNPGVMAVAFPKLKKLKIDDMKELAELEPPVLKSLQELALSNCPMLRALPPSLGKFESLESLKLSKLPQVNYLGQEFYGFDDSDTSNSCVMVVAFPQLKVLEISSLDQLVKWELPVAGDNKSIMPYLRELELCDCPMLRTLPRLGTLESLESLWISKLPMIKQVGLEFWGISAAAVAADEFGGCSTQERVINGSGEGEEPIIPNLRTTLRNLCSSSFSRIKCLGLAFFGIAENKESEEEGREGSSSSSSSSSSYVRKPVILFPKLTELEFKDMDEMEDWILPLFQEDRQIMPCLSELKFSSCGKLRLSLPDLAQFKSLEILKLTGLNSQLELEGEEREGGINFPCLLYLYISDCPNLRVIPSYLFPHTLRKLVIGRCDQLRGEQPCLPKLLEVLILIGDVGVFSESLPIGEEENNNYPNLIYVRISLSNHPSLPKGFNHLTAIQYLEFWRCESLNFDLNELKHLTKLRDLDIDECPILSKRFQSPGADWMSILSHVPNIKIDDNYIKGSI